jgi:hypothetical protein
MENTTLKVILTGATGMVGEGVLIECLQHPRVEAVLVIGRKSCGYTHVKLKEIIQPDILGLKAFEKELAEYNTCFFCAGVSSVGTKELEYSRITYTLTLNFAEMLSRINPEFTFEFISAAGSDPSESSSIMWARVKGRTENELVKIPFKKVYIFRPGFLKATPGQKNVQRYYRYINWLYPLLRKTSNTVASSISELGLAMINAGVYGFNKTLVPVNDIIKLADI